MDDIRRPQRRDYALPSHRPAAPHHPQHHPQPHPTPHQAPQQPAPAHHAPVHHSSQPSHPQPPVYHQPQYTQTQPGQPAAQPQPAYHQPAHHQPQTQPAAHHKASRRFGKKVTVAGGALLAAAAIFGAGYLLKSPDTSAKGIPDSITRQVNYALYFPSPMPPGYTYMKDTATFQIGQVYYKFASGKKRVTVTEQPMPSQKPDLSLYKGYIAFDSPVGKAVVGTNLGESQAIVLTPTTVITMNTVSGVSTDDLHSAVNALRNIGQNPQKP